MPEKPESMPNNAEASSPMTGMRVFDATDMRGALAARLLADLGADVLRAISPDESDEVLKSSEHLFRNANKRAVVLSVESLLKSDLVGRASKNADPALAPEHAAADHPIADPADVLHELLSEADVFVENFTDPNTKKLAAELSKNYPDLIHVQIRDFRSGGPKEDWVLEPLPAFAASGAHWVSGFPHLPPCWMLGFLAHDCASVFAATGTIAAFMDKRRTGKGQTVEVSVQEASLSGLNPWSVAVKDYLKVNPRMRAEGKRNGDISYWVLKASDGWVKTVLGLPHHWRGFLEVMGNPEALSDPEWERLAFRLGNIDVARMIIDGRGDEQRTRDEISQEAVDANTIIGPLYTAKEFVNHPQTKHRNFFVKTDWEDVGGSALAGPPWKLSKTPASLRTRAPRKGQSDAAWLARREEKLDPNFRLPKTGALLENTMVVEFGMAAVVPELCWVLSELGADVIKVESQTHPDVLRFAGPEGLNTSFAFNSESRGRRSVAVDMQTPQGRQIVFDLCAKADIVAENYRGGVLSRLGLGYEDIKKVNPGVVYASSQGYGRGGPMGEKPAFGPINAGFAGVGLLWNHPEAERPCGTSLNHPDHIAGKMLSAAVLAALDHRCRTGEGQLVDMAQTEAAAYLLGEVYLEGSRSGKWAEANGNRSTEFVPHDVYEAADEDTWVAISVSDDEAWQNLAAATELHDFPPAWATKEGRLRAREEIDAHLKSWCKTVSAEKAAQHLQQAGVSAMFLQGPAAHLNDVQLKDFIVELKHKEIGKERHVGNPIKMSSLKMRTAESSPCLGAHTHEVLKEVLGLGGSEVDQLIADKICV